ncbi:PREDICTED: U4/U6 small nuclear ribonucleoprotein Prp31 [Hipposideros armiger]|uniref:U4/U6 small nuclear ribonucleoprotein Prp31 n=1 Tax=Hipposideros armiger TaxID=186990 RepID=A0A8B7PXT2_HIPAR|nr:PREDICTED: U4/U6 small nuclear ribonucleoprotein Prp31 [Hipposideros armiger]
MSLADELLADLEEAAEEEEGGSYGEEEEEPTIEDVQEETQLDLSGDSVKSIAKLWDSKMFAEIMMKIEEYISKQAKASEGTFSLPTRPHPPRLLSTSSLAGPPWDPTRHSRKGAHTVSSQTNAPASSDPSPTLPPAVGVAGGLTNLSKMPACNIMLLGAQRKTLSGFSSTSVLPHTGYIYHSDIVQSLPPDLRRKAARLVAAKCTLAARVDSFHESTEGKVGYELKDEIERKFDKWQEPPPVKQVKPLPAPLDGQRKKRGGRRYRKMKERLGLTEIRKQANRMSFGEIEEDAYQEDLGFSLGHLGKSGSGRVRQTQVNEATKARISKTLQRTLQKQSVVYGGKSTIRDRSSGTASSVAFTPLQGLEIVNPQAAEKKVAEANQKYFSSMAEFLKVKGEKSGIMST